jgi:DNA processing protein
MPSAHDDDVALWVALNQIQGLGSVGICRLLAEFKSPENIFSASVSQLKQHVDEDVAASIHKGVDTQAIEPTLQWLSKDRAYLITLADANYPKPLLEIDNPPPILYAYGNLEVLNQHGIAIVGSRHATPQGEKNAEDFAQNLCDQGLCIISGMALGIDGAAHRGALKSHGHTIAVVGTGLDIVYPAKHRELAHRIAEHGLLISEFPLGTPSKAQNFPRRNRIISGLSLGCLVVEANIESGSLITARLAAEQGREVFAIPGSIHSPVSKGCHQLIKQGAKLVESTSDIMEELKNMLSEISPNGSIALSGQSGPETNPLLVSMGFDPVSFDTLLSLSGLTTDRLSAMLMMLELEGKITNINGGKYQRLV